MVIRGTVERRRLDGGTVCFCCGLRDGGPPLQSVGQALLHSKALSHGKAALFHMR